MFINSIFLKISFLHQILFKNVHLILILNFKCINSFIKKDLKHQENKYLHILLNINIYIVIPLLYVLMRMYQLKVLLYVNYLQKFI